MFSYMLYTLEYYYKIITINSYLIYNDVNVS